MNLDIIIPCYNAKDTITRTLSSICLQKNIEQVKIYLINDCSDYDYSFYIKLYSNFINIQELRTPSNIGPGGAREFGLQHSSSKYIVFIDSDDQFYSYDSLNTLYNETNNKKYHILITDFLYIRDNEEKIMKKDMTWLHGKIYDRDFINKNDVHFNETRANEDNGFNRLLFLLSNDNFGYLEKLTYIYNENPNSITRKNNREYRFTGLEGFIYNMNWAMTEALKRGTNRETIMILSMNVIVAMYFYYLELYKDYDASKILEWSKTTKRFLVNNNEYDPEKFKELVDKKRNELDTDLNIKEFITFDEFYSKIEI